MLCSGYYIGISATVQDGPKQGSERDPSSLAAQLRARLTREPGSPPCRGYACRKHSA